MSGNTGNSQTLQAVTMTNAGHSSDSGGPTLVQYRHNQDGQFFVPVSVSPSDLQGYTLQSGGGMVLTSGMTGTGEVVEEASRKREVRLMKNREAARECRRKKKEYIKCLESRVAVLENQNKALIDELKTLKELYCEKAD
jgi:pyridoxal biosynthesis lyase PdxS